MTIFPYALFACPAYHPLYQYRGAQKNTSAHTISLKLGESHSIPYSNVHTKFRVSLTIRSWVLGPRWAPNPMHRKPVSPKRGFYAFIEIRFAFFLLYM